MDVSELFKGEGILEILENSIPYFYRSDRSEEEIEAWLNLAVKNEKFKEDPSLAIILFGLLCDKCKIDETIANRYVRTAVSWVIREKRSDICEGLLAKKELIEKEGPKSAMDFVERYEIRKDMENKKSKGKKKETGMPSELSKEEEALINRNSFIKGAVLGLLVGALTTGAIFSAVGGKGNKVDDPQNETVPVVTEASTETDIMNTMENTETDTDEEKEEETKAPIVVKKKIYCSDGTVRVREDASTHAAILALADGAAELIVEVGETYPDLEGKDMTWTEILVNEELLENNPHFEVYHEELTDSSRFFIASQFLMDADE